VVGNEEDDDTEDGDVECDDVEYDDIEDINTPEEQSRRRAANTDTESASTRTRK
jgi:hypothetical protein